MSNNIKKLITFSPESVKQLEAIKDKRGFLSTGEAMRSCIAEIFRKEFPMYVKEPTVKLTIDQKAEREAELQLKTKQAKADKYINEGKAFCDILEGQVIDNYCHWKSYELRNDGTVEITPERQAITYVGQSEIDNQFMVSGDKVSKEVYNKKKKILNAKHLKDK